MVPANLTAIMLAIRQLGYQVQRSLRFRGSASASLSRTPSVSGNRKLLARRFRVKLGTLGTLRVIASAGTASIDRLYLDSSDRLCLDVLGTQRLVSTPLLRDPTAWYVDVELQLDVANGTAAQRAKILVDGTELTYTSDSRASITNTDTNWNNTVIHYIGRDNAGNYFDGHIAEPIGVDGAVTSTYSNVNGITGQRVAVRPSATYGTTGYYLDFSDQTSLTTLMADRSGNGNNWTANNISLTAGATYDSMIDVPLGIGGQERGNYCTFNPLYAQAVNVSMTNANLSVTLGSATNRGAAGTVFVSSGKWYFEYQSPGSSSVDQIGVVAETGVFSGGVVSQGVLYWANGNKSVDGSTSAYGATYTSTDVIGVELDNDIGTVTFFKNGVSQGSISITVRNYTVAISDASGLGSGPHHINTGQRPFSRTPSTGFKALHTGNLTNITPITSGSFTGNASADGRVVWCNGTPETLTINGNAVTWGTHADKTAGGFKLRTSSASYNSSGTNTWTATYLSPASKSAFKYQLAKAN